MANFETSTPSATDNYLESIDYSTNEIDKTVKLTATYLYS